MTTYVDLKPGVYYLLLVSAMLLAGCDNEQEPAMQDGQTNVTKAPVLTIDEQTEVTRQKIPAENNQPLTQFNLGNKSYLFDVSDHTIEELEALLARAHEISQLNPKEHDDFEIVMILHGPDIEWFTQDKYEENRKLIDLAARLDAFDVIDMKVCETAMDSRGVKREDIPAFIESVPYAPDEIRRLTEEGIINL